jgi:histidinol-phosphate aminotransferase
MRFKEYIAGMPSFRPPRLGNRPIIKMNANENPLGPSPKAVAAMHEAVEHVNRYPDAGSTALRERLAERFGLDPDQVLCTNGSDETILLLSMAFLGEGDEAISAAPSFVSYAMRTKVMGGQIVNVPLREYTPDLDAMADAVTERTRLIFLCNPNNPTGPIVTADQTARFLESVPEDVLIVADEAYNEFAPQEDFPDLISEVRKGRQNLVVLRTFAKIYGLAGLRLGYTFGHPDVISYIGRTRTVFNVSAVAQAGGLAALEDDAHVQRGRAHAEASRTQIGDGLRALGLEPVPSATNFMCVQVGDDAGVAAALMERGIAINPLTGWGLPGHIRISFGTEEENARFLDALKAALEPAGVRA